MGNLAGRYRVIEETQKRLEAPEPKRSAEPKTKATLKPMRMAGRPTAGKTQVSMRLDDDVLAALKASGRGWQTRLNAVLRKHFGIL